MDRSGQSPTVDLVALDQCQRGGLPLPPPPDGYGLLRVCGYLVDLFAHAGLKLALLQCHVHDAANHEIAGFNLSEIFC